MTPMEAFDEMLRWAASDGRDALFGDLSGVRDAMPGAIVGDMHPVTCLEFPLAGTPGLDAFAFYEHVGAGPMPDWHGNREVLEWYSTVDGRGETCVGLTMDLSDGCDAGAYMQYRSRDELIAPFMGVVGADPAGYLSVRDAMPAGWSAEYVGNFPNRDGGPTRLGGYLSDDVSSRYALDPSAFGDDLRSTGYGAVGGDMPALCSELMRGGRGVDFQLDVMSDGTLGGTFGLSLSLNECGMAEVREFMRHGYGAHVAGTLVGLGLADGRVAALAEMARADVSDGLWLWAHPSHIKVKFADGEPQYPAKAYVAMAAIPMGGR